MPTAVRNGRYRRGAPICLRRYGMAGTGAERQYLRRYKGGVAVDRPRAADDFATTRARIEELRRERQGEDSANRGLQSGQLRRGLAAIAPAPLPIAQNLGAVVAILSLGFRRAAFGSGVGFHRKTMQSLL